MTLRILESQAPVTVSPTYRTIRSVCVDVVGEYSYRVRERFETSSENPGYFLIANVFSEGKRCVGYYYTSDCQPTNFDLYQMIEYGESCLQSYFKGDMNEKPIAIV